MPTGQAAIDTDARGLDESKTPPVPTKMGGQKGAFAFMIFSILYTYYVAIKSHTPWTAAGTVANSNAVLESIHGKSATDQHPPELLQCNRQCALETADLNCCRNKGIGHCGPGIDTQAGNGNRGLFVLLLNIAGLLIVNAFYYDVTCINYYLVHIVTSYMILCIPLSVLLYWKGRSSERISLTPHGNTGYVFYDWFMGRELNPRWGRLDVKYVMFRSAIIAWILLNICTCLEFYKRHNGMNPNLLTVSVLQTWYVVDLCYFERGLIVSREVVSEGFGTNLLQQFVMIPVGYAVQTRYLCTTEYSSYQSLLVACMLIFGLGYYIYRTSNSEKNIFRENPDDPRVAHLRTLRTSTGKSLLISGWWGRCRHPNYLGDVIISLSFALLTGVGHALPYLGTCFLLVMLLDRLEQDNEDCSRKYGNDWHRYCNIVKYKMVPGVY